MAKSTKEMDKLLEELGNLKNLIRRRAWREGDEIYLKCDNADPLKKYFLIERFNNSYAWKVSVNKNAKTRVIHQKPFNGVDGCVHISNISDQRPKTCHCCGHILEDKKC